MNYLKAFFFTAVFALSLNVATAQKSSKKSQKETTQQRVEQSNQLSAKEPTYKWAYSVALVTDLGGKFEIKFTDGKSKTSQRLSKENHELRKKMEAESEEIATEGDLINMLTDLKMELISVVSIPESGGRTMKYYLRTKIAE